MNQEVNKKRVLKIKKSQSDDQGTQQEEIKQDSNGYKVQTKIYNYFQPKIQSSQVLTELKTKLKQKNQQLQLKKSENDKYKKLKNDLSANRQKLIKQYQEYNNKAKFELCESLKQMFKYRRNFKDKSIENDRVRLGYYDRAIKQWIDGIEIKKIKNKILEINKQISILQQQSNKKSILKLLHRQLQIQKTKLKSFEKQKIILDYTQKLFLQEKRCRFFNSWPIIQNKYQILQLIGKGGFSQVYKGFDLQQFTYVAIKVHAIHDTETEYVKNNYIKHAQRQYETHKQLTHQNIAKFKNIIKATDFHGFYTILQFCEGPDLSFYLKTHQIIPQNEAKIMIKQVFSALSYLNQRDKKVIHFDLKPSNLVLHKGIIKLVDFGLCKIIQNSKQTKIQLTSPGVGTYWYLPPQCFQCDGKVISNKVDIWSAGVIFYQFLYGKKPFGHDMSQEMYVKRGIIKNLPQLQFPKNVYVSQEAKILIQRCLTYNVCHRISIDQIIKSQYFIN